MERYSNVYKQLLSMANKNVDIHTFGYTEAEMEYDEENQTFVRVKDENKAQNVNALLGPITAHAESGKDYSSLAGDRNYIAYSVSDDPSGINQMSSVRLYASSKGNRANYYRTINSYYVHTWKSLSIKVSASASANSDKKYGVSLSITPSVSEKSWQVYSYVSFQL